ncbi:ATP-binding cassette, subfamily B [Pilibacter termitis]|uniref:ATP-binding cassette, subfamily B n=1 Tax=Pilibacter termitis TaxID=263852 RepID=A0A1T4L214_9ENTE|nr:ABC transporter ATP-binding protein/permease [Pilibacter termitis]SJZ48683.1 ATP-binding cassette, subfamily B [Pilibacter termitis]
MIDRRLLKMLNTKALVFLVLLKIVQLLTSLALWLTIAFELTHYFQFGKLNKVVLFTLWIVTLFVVRMVLTKKMEQLTLHSSDELRVKFRSSVLRKSFRLGEHPQFSPAKLSQLAVEGVEQLEIYYARFLPQLFYCLFASLLLFAVLACFSWKIAIVLLIGIPLIPIVIMLVMRVAKKILGKYWHEYTSLGEKFHENLQGLAVLKAFEQDERKQVEMETDAEKFRKATMSLLSMQLNSITVMDIISYSGAGLSIGLALRGFAQNEISLFGLLVFILLSAEMFIPMRQLGSLFHVAMNGISATSELFSYLELPEYSFGKATFEEELSKITLENLHFSYEENANNYSLEGISCQLERGKFHAIIGSSGSGKSTIAKILTAQLPNYQGKLQWNDVELNVLSEKFINEKACYVNNQQYLYAGSIKENLLFANAMASEEEIWSTLEQVNLKEFVKNLPNQLEEVLYENASNLSGGQRQRLILARALLANASFYAFDEITSGIDLESEKIIVEVIQKLAKEKLVLFISHRLYNVLEADKVFVCENGRLSQQGNPKELMEETGYFQSYFTSEQALFNGGER